MGDAGFARQPTLIPPKGSKHLVNARAGRWVAEFVLFVLRSAIAARYYGALRISSTIDERLGSAVPRFVSSLEEAGLSPAGGASDAQVAAVLRQNPSLVAGLKNVRYSAARMMGSYVGALTRASGLLEEVTGAIESPDSAQ